MSKYIVIFLISIIVFSCEKEEDQISTLRSKVPEISLPTNVSECSRDIENLPNPESSKFWRGKLRPIAKIEISENEFLLLMNDYLEAGYPYCTVLAYSFVDGERIDSLVISSSGSVNTNTEISEKLDFTVSVDEFDTETGEETEYVEKYSYQKGKWMSKE